MKPGMIEQWSKDFIGPVEHYAVAADTILASGTPRHRSPDVFREQAFGIAAPHQRVARHLRRNLGCRALRASAFVYSSLGKPDEVYLADSADKVDQARAITSFNKLFTERDLPQGKPYQWKADDGTTVEGMLIYPPGKFEAKHLPMLTLIHGGPADADGNHFDADWYEWAALAATNGWLVFRSQLSRVHRIRRQVPRCRSFRRSSRVRARTFSQASTRW